MTADGSRQFRDRPPLAPDLIGVALVELDRIHEASVDGGTYELLDLARTLGRYQATPVGDPENPRPLAHPKYARVLLGEACHRVGSDPDSYLREMEAARAAEVTR